MLLRVLETLEHCRFLSDTYWCSDKATRVPAICSPFPSHLRFSAQARTMDTLTTLSVLLLYLFLFYDAEAKKPRKCYKDEGCCFKAEGCNLVIPPKLNNSIQTFENCTICKPHCSEPEQKPLLLRIKFDIVGMKDLPQNRGPFSFYRLSME